MRLRVEEKDLDHAVWGSVIDVEVEGEDEELAILEFVEKHVKREHNILHDGKPLNKTISERIRELRRKGVRARRRGRR